MQILTLTSDFWIITFCWMILSNNIIKILFSDYYENLRTNVFSILGGSTYANSDFVGITSHFWIIRLPLYLKPLHMFSILLIILGFLASQRALCLEWLNYLP